MRRRKPIPAAFDMPCPMRGCTAHIRMVTNPHTKVTIGYHGEDALLETTMEDLRADLPEDAEYQAALTKALEVWALMMVECVAEWHMQEAA